MTESVLKRLLLATGLLAGLLTGLGSISAAAVVSVLAITASWLVRGQQQS